MFVKDKEIEMVEKRYQVFISSTFTDLKDVRSEVEKTLYQTGYIPVGMECFGAQNKDVTETIKKYLKGTDLAVFLIAGRYGSTNAKGVSFTESEYDYIREQGIPVLVFIRNDNYIPISACERGQENKRKLGKFKEKLRKNHHVVEWTTTEDLIKQLLRSLMATKLQSGWIHLEADSEVQTKPVKETTIECGITNIKVKGSVIECEKGEAEIIYLGSAIVDSPNKPVKYKDIVQAPEIFSYNFNQEITVLNEKDFKRNPTILYYEVTAPDAESKLSFTGEVLLRRELRKEYGAIGFHIPYYAKYMIFHINIAEAPFIRDYNGEAKLINSKEEIESDKIEKTDYNSLSMTYTVIVRDAPANSTMYFEWKNNEF